MTLEPDPAAVLVHERLEQAVSSMRAPDVEAGWAALAAQLEAPIAPVVPAAQRPPAGGSSPLPSPPRSWWRAPRSRRYRTSAIHPPIRSLRPCHVSTC